MKRIAVEEHSVPEILADYLRSKNDQSSSRYESGRLFAEKRLKEMDEAGIDMQVLSVGLMGLDGFPASEATPLSRQINDEIAEVVKKYPGKFEGFAVLAPQDPEAAADELERAVNKLGLKGTMIVGHVNGEYLDEKKFWVILERAANLDVPIYIHPKQPSPAIIKPYSKYPQLLTGAWGFGADTGLHAMRLICSGVFDQYPNLRIILGHMGEALPFWLWRMGGQERIGTMREELNQPQKSPAEYVKGNFYFTTSGCFWPTVIQFVYLAIGADSLMFGIDYIPSEHSLESNKRAVQALESTPMCDGDREKIFHLNAEKILKLKA